MIPYDITYKELIITYDITGGELIITCRILRIISNFNAANKNNSIPKINT